MRVLAVCDFYHPRSGGVERVVAETARQLINRGLEVEILTRRLSPNAPSCEVVDGITVWRVGGAAGPFAAELASVGLEGRAWVAEHMHRFDLVHAHLSFVVTPILGAIRAARRPLVATFYGPWDREYRTEIADLSVPSRWGPLRGLAQPVMSRAFRRLQSRLLRSADSIVVLSEHSRGELGQFDGLSAPVIKVPGGVDVTRFCLADRSKARARLGLKRCDGPLLVSVRRLVPRMGLDRLIAALPALSKEFAGLQLAIAGTGPLEQALREQAGQLGLADRVHMLGRVPEEQLASVYAASDLVVIPTRALEGFGLPVLEAWASGRGVVSTPVGALTETVSRLDPGLVAAGTDASDLARAVSHGLALESRELPERARHLALSYSWEKVTGRLMEVYHRSIPRRRTE